MLLPEYSVIIPTHKRSVLLRRALESVKNQGGGQPLEVIVVSDVTDPATDAVCAEMLGGSDTYVRRGGQPGPAFSRNLALSLAKGRYVMFLDDDDAWHPGLLEQLGAQYCVASGKAIYWDCTVVQERRLPDGPEFVAESHPYVERRLTPAVYVKNQIHMSCFAFPRQQLQGLQFDPSMRAYEDWDFLLSVFDRGLPSHVPLLGSRVFEVWDNTTDRRGSSRKAGDGNAVLDYLYVYRRHPAPTPDLARQRVEVMLGVGLRLDPDML